MKIICLQQIEVSIDRACGIVLAKQCTTEAGKHCTEIVDT
jgi:hypothetical protein